MKSLLGRKRQKRRKGGLLLGFSGQKGSVAAGANSSHGNLTVYYMKSPRLVSAVEPLGDLGAKAYFFFLKSPLFQASMNSFQAKALNIC